MTHEFVLWPIDSLVASSFAFVYKGERLGITRNPRKQFFKFLFLKIFSTIAFRKDDRWISFKIYQKYGYRYLQERRRRRRRHCYEQNAFEVGEVRNSYRLQSDGSRMNVVFCNDPCVNRR